MALITCPDCTRSVSDAAASCPNCGRPIAPPSLPPVASHDEHISPDLVVAFVRTIVEATFRPTRFLARWREEPQRYATPKRVLVASAIVSGVIFSLTVWIRPNGMPTLVQKVLAAVVSILSPWISVIAYRLTGRLVRVRLDWGQATRVAAFVRAPALFLSPLTLALTVAVDSKFGTGALTLAAALFYGSLGLQPLGVPRGRALAGALLAWLLGALAWALIAVGLATVLLLFGDRFPELKFQHP